MQIEEPIIIGYGRQLIDQYPVQEYVDSLRRAFIIGRAECVVLDSNLRGQRFLFACAAWAFDGKILWNDLNIDDSQSAVCSFRITEYGKKFLESENTEP
ncbi:MAG: hypothetical protein ACHQU0_02470 [Candidatus Paceibacteria bacterium]